MSLGPWRSLSGYDHDDEMLSVSVPVADQDAALAFYTEVLGCDLQTDAEVWPGARMIEVVPPGSSVSLTLLSPDSQIPVAIRLGTADAQQAHDKIREAGVTQHHDELVRLEGSRRCSPSPIPTATVSSTWRTPIRASGAERDHLSATSAKEKENGRLATT